MKAEFERGNLERGDLDRGKQSKVLDVDKGLLLLRYATADDDKRPPKIRILVNPKHTGCVELVLNPEHSDAVLWQPGSCLVVRATAPAQLFVEVIAIEEGGSTAATLKIETLSQGKATAPARKQAASRSVADSEIDLRRLTVRGHVAGIGDVTVRADEWIAGPVAPARVEGLSVDWPGKPDDVDIRYAVRLARPHAVSGKAMQLGDYAGTRGRALPIVGVSLELTGKAAVKFRLTAEAVFLGAPVQRVSGAQVEMAGPTRREPLVGFRLRLDEVNVPLQLAHAPAVKPKLSGRVRVFRSPAAQGLLQ
jgi:hypothetical protein